MLKTAIILAGGKGLQLQSEVSNLPKQMTPVNGRPFLSIVLEHLHQQEFEQVVLAVGYLHEKISNYYKSMFKSMKLIYSIEDKPLGSGGAIKLAFEKVRVNEAFIINGDTYIHFNAKPLYELYKYVEGEPIVLLKPLNDFDRYGSVEFDKDFMITSFAEKKYCESGYINAGVYLINKSIFKSVSGEVFSFEKDILEKNHTDYSWYGFPQDGYFKDISIPEDYHQFIQDDKNKLFRQKLAVDESWTLFLDRDGVINKRKVGGYIQSVGEFEFLPGVLDAIARFTKIFNRICVVTNQQGIGKRLFSVDDLKATHHYMQSEITQAGGRIDGIYFCPDLEKDNSPNRKPNTGMGLQAKMDFPDLAFHKSIIFGDSDSDIEFGKRLGMTCIKVDSPNWAIQHNLPF